MPPAVRQTGMTPLDLEPGSTVQLEAIDPTTGLPVAGVTVSDATIYALTGDGLSGESALRSIYLVGSGD